MTHEELKSARIKLGLTQQGLADKLGLSRVMVGLMERGDKPVQKVTALAVECLTLRAGHITN